MRVSTVSGKEIYSGMTDGHDFYCAEDEFDSAMDQMFGKENWKATEKEGEYGGFYEVDGEDTGIYWTEWEE